MNLSYDLNVKALEMWKPEIVAKADDGKNTINIYDQIGVDPWTGLGVTAKLVASVLRSAGGEDVVVNINSPGGDFFEGLSIHTLLKDYDGNVKIRVVGLAASAASVIAMASDDVEIAKEGFLMIHNAWCLCMGNRHDMGETSKILSKFDESMRDLYAEKTGLDSKKVSKMMDSETWINGKEAVEMGFVSGIMGKEKLDEDKDNVNNSSLKKVDIALARAGMSRSERRELIKDLTSTPSATEDTPSAVNEELFKALSALNDKLKRS
jgi:ATP-dependent protease ClpP protease subunit